MNEIAGRLATALVDRYRIEREHKLFEGPYLVERSYDVTADGSKFLMVRVDPRPEALPILVITNFFEELRKKVGR
jgi:hypothetical protein